MTQAQLNREVARVTGETVSEICRRGFGPADPEIVAFDPEPFDAEIEKYLDWDEVAAERAAPALC